MYQDPDSDRYLFPREKVFDNAADDFEIIAVSKRSINLSTQKEAVKEETKPLSKIWCVKMEDDTHQPDELSTELSVMKTYMKARYRISD